MDKKHYQTWINKTIKHAMQLISVMMMLFWQEGIEDCNDTVILNILTWVIKVKRN